MARLLTYLVEHVGHAGIRQVLVAEHQESETGIEHRLEANAGIHDRTDFLTAESGPLFLGEIQVEPRNGEELVGQESTWPQPSGKIDVGIDDPTQGCGRESLGPNSHRCPTRSQAQR